ncbi:MAG: hypothetical protein HN353_08710 [Bdellovibrionales bacterium]|nr:hypothetical protein [Bdellovibrionales bacterium]MBT3526902.1 hypothetical protein [Bdellovibrionales bacterium]MBT7669650.1 hypothetical protein [Bdellovibrionales bacterium]MBT7767283.1 hypothetical protein [Bdellovibrionales bacterium]
MKKKNGFWQFTLTMVLISGLFFSCSKARDQYERGGAGENSNGTASKTGSNLEGTLADSNATLLAFDPVGSGNRATTGGATGSGNLSTEEEDRRVRENRVKPIDYNTGFAAGITMTTTFEQAADILSTPRVSGDWYVYNEGIYVLWRENAPRYPNLIWVNSSYEGRLVTGNQEIGDLFIGRKVADQDFGPESELGEQFLIKLFNFFHNMDADYNCIATTRCEIRFFAESNAILWMMPRLILNFSSDRKEIADMRVRMDDSSGEQNAAYDVLNGSFKSTAMDITFSLGQNYNDLVSFQGSTSDFIDPSTNSMYVRYGNVYNVLSRSDYSRTYKIPLKTEVIKGFALGGDFENDLSINGAPIFFALDESGVSYTLSHTVFEGGMPLQMKTGFDKNKGLKSLQFKFMAEFEAMLMGALDLALGFVGSSTWGVNYFKDTERMETSIYQYDFITNEGKLIYFQMDRIQGNLSWIQTSQLISPFNKMTAGAYFNAHETSKNSPLTSVGEYTFDQKVRLLDLDRALETVTVEIAENVERAGITERAILKTVPIGEGKFLEQEVVVVSPSDFPVTLLLVKTEEDYAVQGISFSTSHDRPFTMKCGTETVSLNFGSSDAQVVQQLANFKSCVSVRENSTDGAEMLETIHFPELKLMLNFDENEFASVTIYKN